MGITASCAMIYGLATEVFDLVPSVGWGIQGQMVAVTWADLLAASALPPLVTPPLCVFLMRFTRYPVAALQIFGTVVLLASFYPVLLAPTDSNTTRAVLGLLHLVVGLGTLIAFSRTMGPDRIE
jgi:hypothetical protein